MKNLLTCIEAMSLEEKVALLIIVGCLAICLLCFILCFIATQLHKFFEVLKNILRRAVFFFGVAFCVVFVSLSVTLLGMSFLKQLGLAQRWAVDWVPWWWGAIVVCVVVSVLVAASFVRTSIKNEKNAAEEAIPGEAVKKLKEALASA